MRSANTPDAQVNFSAQDAKQAQGRIEVDLANLIEESPIAFYTCDHKGFLTFYNNAAARLWGRKPELGKDLWCGSWKIFYPDGRPMPLSECPMAKTLKKGIPHENESITIERPDHTIRNLLVFPKPIFDEKQKLKGAHNTLVDITDQQRGELKQATLSAIVESSDDAIISKDLNGIITSWNSGAEKIFGYNEKEVLGKSITMLIPKNRLPEEKLIISKIRNGEKVDHFETIRKGKNGKDISISLTVSPLKNSQGEIIGASKVARDVTAQVQAQAEIKKYARNLEILSSVGKSISANLDVKITVQRVTDATTKLSGAAFGAFFYNQVNAQGESLKLFTLSGAPREAFEGFGMPRNTDVFNPTFTGRDVVRVDDITKDTRYGHNHPHHGTPKGHLSVVSYLAVPVKSTSGNVIGGLFFGHPKAGMFKAEHEDLVVNIAAQAAIALDNAKLFEQVKSLSEKKDEFIALASHELKTPLTTVKGYLQVLSKNETDRMSELFLSKSLHQINKLNKLVEDLLHMSRIEAGKLDFDLEIIDVRQMLYDIAETFSYSYESHSLITEFGDGPAIIEGDKQRIEQAIMNLLNNAVKYSPKADEVQLKLEVAKEKVTIAIEDKGIGLSQEQQNKLFTRYYRAESTKGIGGLGLGLYLTKQIIDHHNGEMRVSSKPGEGSEFSIILPQKITKGN